MSPVEIVELERAALAGTIEAYRFENRRAGVGLRDGVGHPGLSMLLCSLLLCVALPARAPHALERRGRASEHWHRFDAAIDGGDPGASEVTLDSQDTIGSLQVAAGDTLVVTPTGQLTLDGDRIENVGELVLHGTGELYPGSFVLNAPDTALSGGGSIRMEGGEILGNSLMDADNRISGMGSDLDPRLHQPRRGRSGCRR